MTDLLTTPVPGPHLPLALARCWRTLAVGDRCSIVVPHGPPDDDPCAFERHALRRVCEGAGFTAVRITAERGPGGAPRLRARMTRARSLPDVVGPGMRLLVVGLNPSEYAADVGVGFARGGNRFWPAALAAGIASTDRDPDAALADHGTGMTDLVKRATRTAAEVSAEEFRAGGVRLAHLVAWLRPAVVCVAGVTGWRAAVDRRAAVGPQPAPLGGRPVYVMPNPSGLNAHDTVASLAEHLRSAVALGRGSDVSR